MALGIDKGYSVPTASLMNESGEHIPEGWPAKLGASRLVIETYILANGSRLLAYIRKVFPPLLQSIYDPIDVYQTTVFEAFRRAPRFQFVSDEATMGWLKVMARRQIGMALRRERRRVSVPGQDGESAHSGKTLLMLEEYVTYLRTPSKSAIRHEVLHGVEQSMQSLPAHLREAVKLRHLDGLPMAEVAVRLGRTEAAAATLCYRGLRLLQRKLRTFSRY